MSLKLTATLAKAKDIRFFEALKVAMNVTTHMSLLELEDLSLTFLKELRDELGPAEPKQWSQKLRQVAEDLRQ
ncbi:hypothetical protein FYK55_28790 [Roseiconus nitratireducens]|uniref:Uncharacterized protein n=2 Tax=Roseiconus nitratireducens TaxID=2605748 RepID=A0A5M6C9Z7_9BACT|nr:hypothetical protein FYK55_28790 [Roseiconus nitratireducens]